MRPGELIVIIIAVVFGILLLILPARYQEKGYEQGLIEGSEIARHSVQWVSDIPAMGAGTDVE